MNPIHQVKRTLLVLGFLSCFLLAACEPKSTAQSNVKQEDSVSAAMVKTNAAKPNDGVKAPTAHADAASDNAIDDKTAPGATLSLEQADEVLRNAVDMKESNAIIYKGVDTIEGKTCYTYSYGENHNEHFVTLEHFAVCDNHQLLVMDVINGGDYVPYVRQD